ncbi:MAG: 3-hydroxyacyl-CoA dehydrogenase NAD-binding domain-containing protein, partial [Gemmatimonadota bacterium]
RVRIKDIRHEAVSQALQHSRSLFHKAVERRKLSRLDAARRVELVSGGIEYDGFGTLDLVMEAVVERMDVKRTVLAEVEAHLSPEAVLTSNTSTLSIDEMAEALQRPERFAGMHFFNPVHRMPLVEIVRGSRTDARTLATIHALALRMGKTPVVVRDGPGFLVNRVLAPYLNEAGHLLAEGASVEEIDAVARDFGMPMGPLRLIDEVGIDVSRHAGDVLHRAFGARLTPSAPLVALGESGRLGRKGGSGFYRYENGREKGVDPEVYAAMGATVPATRVRIPAADIRGRLFLQMINEAARALEDGIVASAGEADLAMIMGTGFPPFRGGLFRFVDCEHPRTVMDRSRDLQERLGPRFAPAPLLVRLAEEERRFYEAFPAPAPTFPTGNRGDTTDQPALAE